MKLLKFLSLLFIGGLVLSCGGDDDNNDDPQASGLSFPLAVGNYWTYNNVDQTGTTRDSLYVTSVEVADNVVTAEMGAADPANGFMVNLLAQSILTAENGQLRISGSLGSPVDGFPDIIIPFEDMILYDFFAEIGTDLSMTSGEIEQVFEEIPLVIAYVISTRQVALGHADDFKNGISTYFGTSEIVVNMAITAEIEVGGFVIPVSILSAQDVLVVTNDFEQYVGFINSETVVTYELEDLSGLGIDLPFPSSDMQESSAVLDAYVAN